MTKMANHKLSCPECGNEQEIIIWHSLNVSLNSDLREKLFSGEINIFKCAACEYRAFINHPLLYHDMHREYCVQYYQPEVIDDGDFLKMFTKDGKIDMQGLPSQHYLREPHIVFNINEMILYIEFRDRIFGVSQKIKD